MTDTLPLFDVTAVRHPAWTAPDDTTLSIPVRALRTEIARNLTRFDGRTDSDRIVRFCTRCWEQSANQPYADNRMWLMGAVTDLRLAWFEASTPLSTRDINVITDLGERFVTAIHKAIA